MGEGIRILDVREPLFRNQEDIDKCLREIAKGNEVVPLCEKREVWEIMMEAPAIRDDFASWHPDAPGPRIINLSDVKKRRAKNKAAKAARRRNRGR